jgi:ribosomal protein S18 acetylase RimI-like enzyme
MADSSSDLRVEVLTKNEWPRLRSIRLTALRDAPSAFLSNHTDEMTFDEEQWREEFSRGQWNIMVADHKEIGLLGVTREKDTPERVRYLEYLWVAPEFRRAGMGSLLLKTVLGHLRDSGIHTIWLYVLHGNHPAVRFYRKFGFESTDERHLLPGHPAGSEERMELRLV